MNLSEEKLMAYVDGELDAASRLAVEEAMRADPEVASAVARARALRDRIRQAYAPVLDEPVPARLLAAASGAEAEADAGDNGNVVKLRASRPAEPARVRNWRWPQWAAVAASLALGIWIGPWLRDGEPPSMLNMSAAAPLADGELAKTLDTRVTADGPVQGPVQVGLSFRAKDGRYCRTFALAQQSMAGLACRDTDGWHVAALSEATPEQGELRLASTALPPSILAEVDARLEGEPLDADGERIARESGWR